MKLMKKFGLTAFLGACVAAPALAAETVLFQDAFDTDSSASWTIIGDSPTDVPDHTAEFGVDYGSTKVVISGVTNTIPAAPNSAGTTRALKLTINSRIPGENAGVSLFPNGQHFTGNYALRVDLWMNYPGAAYGSGSGGSTEFSTFGINHTGAHANWHSTEAVGDGIWFAMAGEGGAAEDYRSYEWDGVSVISRPGLDGGLIGGDHGDTVFQERFPGTVFESAGAPGKRWVQVEVIQRDGNIIWKVDGYVIAERPNSSPNTAGNIMLGLMDVFPSIATPAEDSFILFDNLRVVQLDAVAPTSITTAATDENLSEPGTDTATLTVTRTGDNSSALLVSYRVYGTAQPGIDYATLPGTVTIPAGQDSATITVTALDDAKAEPNETVSVAVFGSALELRSNIAATATLVDDNDQTAVSMTASDPFAYEGIPSDTGSVLLTRVGDLAPSLTVNLTIGGTAVSGTDFQPLSASFAAGADTTIVKIVPIDNSTITGDRTVTVGLAPGNGYVIANATNLIVTIREDDGAEPGSVIFSEGFNGDGSDWTINQAHPESNRATFNWDYSSMGIPPAPHTTDASTRGLKLEANVGAATFTGLSVSPTGVGVEGDYRLSFDMWINYNGPLNGGGARSTLMFAAGVGTSGTVAQFPGTSVEGVMFAVSGEGGAAADWRAYAASGSPLPIESGVYAAPSLDHTDPYYAPFGRVTAPEFQATMYSAEQFGESLSGTVGMAWHEVIIEKRGTNISWFVDNLRIATIPLTNKEISTNIFVGMFDINSSQTINQELSFSVVDNLKVDQLGSTQPPGEIRITGLTRSENNVLLVFNAPTSMQSFVVEGAATVTGDYEPEANVQVEVVSTEGGIMTRRATVPITTTNRFFLVRQQ